MDAGRPYPPAAEVAELWHAARPVPTDREAARYLANRGLRWRPIVDRDIKPETCRPKLVDYELARVLPLDARCPPWARSQAGSWVESGHRIVLPVYDSRGRLRLLRAWSWRQDEQRKRLAASSCGGRYSTVSGLVMANRFARAMMGARDQHRCWKPWLEAHGGTLRSRLVIVEGEPDYLSACAAWPSWAVIGVVAGAWTAELAETIPCGAEVVLRTDRNEAGDRYAAEIADSLLGHVSEVQRG